MMALNGRQERSMIAPRRPGPNSRLEARRRRLAQKGNAAECCSGVVQTGGAGPGDVRAYAGQIPLSRGLRGRADCDRGRSLGGIVTWLSSSSPRTAVELA